MDVVRAKCNVSISVQLGEKKSCYVFQVGGTRSEVILEPKKIKSVTVSTFPSSICHEVMGLDAKILDF